MELDLGNLPKYCRKAKSNFPSSIVKGVSIIHGGIIIETGNLMKLTLYDAGGVYRTLLTIALCGSFRQALLFFIYAGPSLGGQITGLGGKNKGACSLQ